MNTGKHNLSLKDFPSPFTSLETENNIEVNVVEGSIPDSLEGDFLQVGPRGGRILGEKVHWFDGEGMVSSWSFRNGKAVFKNRFIQTEKVIKEQRRGRRIYRGNFNNLGDSWVKNFGRSSKNPANAWLTDFGDGLLVSGGVGTPVELDPKTLEIRKEKPFLSRIPKRWHNWITEPIQHPKNGSLYVLTGFQRGQNLKPSVELIEVPEKGNARLVAKLNLGDVYLTHALMVTEKFAIIPISPIRTGLPRLIKAMTGFESIFDAFKWYPDEPLCFYVIPLDGKKPVRCLKSDAEHPLHIVNAFEDGNDIVVDCEVYENGILPLKELEAWREKEPLDSCAPGGTLIRYVLKSNDTVVRKECIKTKMIYPFIDEELSGIANSSVFMVTNTSWTQSGLKCFNSEIPDQTRGVDSVEFIGGSPVLVKSHFEPHSWVLCPVYTEVEGEVISWVYIYNSNDFKLVCKLSLPFIIPFSIHSAFIHG